MLQQALLTELEGYCTELGAAPSALLDPETQARLPLFLSQLYQTVKATLFGKPWHLLLHTKREAPTPGELEAHARLVSKHLGPSVAFVFGYLPAFDRNRLLKKQVPFIVPHRQMFLPGGMVDLREVHGSAPVKTTAALSMPAQCLVLHHLQKQSGEVLTLTDWAEKLRYSKMTITRAHRELANAGLVKAAPGKTVVLQFVAERRALWQLALPLLRNPIQHEGYYRVPDVMPTGLLDAGLTALAHFTDLAEGPQRVLATWRLFLQNQPDITPVAYRAEDAVTIQRWWYAPTLLADDGKTVDRLSLFLSLKDSADERIQIALGVMMEGVKW